MKYYIISGEASGDLHASNLMRELKALDKDAHFRAWGGDLMEAQGAHLVKHYRDLAFMGFTEVLMNIRTILRNIDFCKKDILQNKPDVLILIDYPGFNLRIAEFAKANGIKVFYYISPQIWAWKQSRVHKIKMIVDRMFVILPFEKDFYKRFDYEVDFVGHPLLDAVENFSSSMQLELPEGKPVIAILPGSRKQEVSVMLPLMLSMKKHYPNYQFVIAGAPSLPKEFYSPFLAGFDIPLIFGKTYQLLKQSKAALVTSGTATLETALFGVPEVVCYKGGKVSYLIARQLIKVKFISLVNLIMDKEIVKELIQDELNEMNLKLELDKLLEGNSREEMIRSYAELKMKLGGAGASRKTAELMLSYLKV
ncbi:MAG: lipid-A-disaccharide synthase [Bacteroidia bacterium]|nr:lipid-A-disaccharide synthase [Bacteroidia bacterium]